jgi:hypothetical protein
MWPLIGVTCRRGRAACAEMAARGWVDGTRHSKLIRPAVGSVSRMTTRARVDLPQPDSPTRPTVSPRNTSKSTPSTARRVRRGSRKLSRGKTKCLARSRTSCRGALAVKEARQAMWCAIDYDGIINSMLGGARRSAAPASFRLGCMVRRGRPLNRSAITRTSIARSSCCRRPAFPMGSSSS